MEFIEDNTVEKIKLLFVLERMEIPLTENNIIDICTSSNKWFKYLDLKEAMFQLMGVNFICENKIEKTGEHRGSQCHHIKMSKESGICKVNDGLSHIAQHYRQSNAPNLLVGNLCFHCLSIVLSASPLNLTQILHFLFLKEIVDSAEVFYDTFV